MQQICQICNFIIKYAEICKLRNMQNMWHMQNMDLIELCANAWHPLAERPKKIWGDTVANQRSWHLKLL